MNPVDHVRLLYLRQSVMGIAGGGEPPARAALRRLDAVHARRAVLRPRGADTGDGDEPEDQGHDQSLHAVHLLCLSLVGTPRKEARLRKVDEGTATTLLW